MYKKEKPVRFDACQPVVNVEPPTRFPQPATHLRSSVFGLRSSDFGLRTSDLGLRTSVLRPNPLIFKSSNLQIENLSPLARGGMGGLGFNSYKLWACFST